MPAAYVFFGRPINSDTSTALMQAVRTFMGEVDNTGQVAHSSLEISISSGGGDVVAAFALFNELSGFEVPINTHNAGAVDSAAIMPFVAGRRRTASAASAFMFHQAAWTFPAKDNLTRIVINDASRWLGLYEGMMADTVASRSNLTRDRVLGMMREGESLTPQQALDAGLIHAIEERQTPRICRTWQV
jgi:ATP-dependent Clp protease protease subunit